MSSKGKSKLWTFLGRALRLYRSRGFVLGTMVALTVIYFLGVLIPQQRQLSPAAYEGWRQSQPQAVAFLEALGLTDAYRAPLTLFVLALFFLSLVTVIAQRLPALLRHTRLDHGPSLNPGSLKRRPEVRHLPSDDPLARVERIAARLQASGYQTHSPEAGAVRGVRFRWAPLGFLLFHASFGFMLVGGVVLDQTRFQVSETVAVGESFSVKEGPFSEVPRLPRSGIEGIPDVAFRVISITPEAIDGHPTALSAEILLAGEMQPRRMRMNEPAVQGSTNILIMNVGPTALLVCERTALGEDGAFLKLDPTGRRDDTFRLPGCGLELSARPARRSEGHAATTGAGVMLGSSASGAVVASLPEGLEVGVRDGPEREEIRGLLRLEAGQNRLVGPEGAWSLELREVRYYGLFQIVDERGGALLIVGFVLGLLGLCARLLFYRREVVVRAVEDGVYLLVSADGVGVDRRDRLMEALIGPD